MGTYGHFGSSGSRPEIAWQICVLRWQETSMWNCSVAKFTPWQCGLTIEKLKEEVKAFNPSEDEITRILSTVEFVLHGEKLNDLQMTVSDSILDSANVQVIFYVKPANECVNKFGHRVTELRDVRIPSTETSIQEDAFEGCACLLRLVIPESVTWIGDHAGCSSFDHPGVCDSDWRWCISCMLLVDEFDHPEVCDSDQIQSFFWLQLFDEFDHTGVCDSDWRWCFSLLHLVD